MTSLTLTPEARQQIEEAIQHVSRRLQMDIDDGSRPDQWSMEDLVRKNAEALALLAALPPSQAWQDIDELVFPQASVVKREFIERVRLEHDSDLSPDLRGWRIKQFGPANEACSRQFVVIERAAQLQGAQPLSTTGGDAEAVDAKRLDWLFANCRIVYFPPLVGGAQPYPIEHNPHALGYGNKRDSTPILEFADAAIAAQEAGK